VSANASGDKRSSAGAEAKRTAGHTRRRLTFDDPLAALPETARKLLLAAKHIIATDGFAALTLNAVSAASGENKAMISYYFGNKAGLVAAVLDSVIHDEYVASQKRMKHADPRQRRQQLIGEMRRLTDATEEFRVFFELLPHVLREEALRRRIALLYKWYWGMKLEWLGIGAWPDALEDPDLLGLTQVLSAIIDGLAIQAAIDPDLDLANPYRVFGRMLEDSKLAFPDAQTEGDGPAAGDVARRPA
jgi:AcrR family transcriptional regulator